MGVDKFLETDKLRQMHGPDAKFLLGLTELIMQSGIADVFRMVSLAAELGSTAFRAMEERLSILNQPEHPECHHRKLLAILRCSGGLDPRKQVVELCSGLGLGATAAEMLRGPTDTDPSVCIDMRKPDSFRLGDVERLRRAEGIAVNRIQTIRDDLREAGLPGGADVIWIARHSCTGGTRSALAELMERRTDRPGMTVMLPCHHSYTPDDEAWSFLSVLGATSNDISRIVSLSYLKTGEKNPHVRLIAEIAKRIIDAARVVHASQGTGLAGEVVRIRELAHFDNSHLVRLWASEEVPAADNRRRTTRLIIIDTLDRETVDQANSGITEGLNEQIFEKIDPEDLLKLRALAAITILKARAEGSKAERFVKILAAFRRRGGGRGVAEQLRRHHRARSRRRPNIPRRRPEAVRPPESPDVDRRRRGKRGKGRRENNNG